MPALIYLFAGLTIASGGAGDHDRHAGRLHDPADRLFFPIQSLLSVGVDVQSSLALFERVFEYLELPVEIGSATGAVRSLPARSAARSASRASASGTRPEADWTLRGVDLEVPAGTTLAVVGETGSGKTTLAYLLARLYESRRAR